MWISDMDTYSEHPPPTNATHVAIKLRSCSSCKFPPGSVCTPGRWKMDVSPACPPAMKRDMPWRIEDYTLLRELGRGRCSVVHQAICKISHCPVALKSYRKDKLSDITLHQVEREAKIHVKLLHKNLIQCYGVFEDEVAIYMVLELAASGDLMKILSDNGNLTEPQVVEVLTALLPAVEYLHSQSVIHRDIKPENIVFMRNGALKLADLGSAINIRDERPVSRLGTLDYMAPEVIRCPDKKSRNDNKDRTDLEYCTSVDCWAVGVLTFELLTGSPPFVRDTMADTIDTILSMQEQFPTSVSNAARKFVRRALHKQAKIRPAVQQLMMDPFLTHPPVQPACDDRTLLKLVLPERYSRNLSCSMLKEKGSFPSSPSPPTDFQKYYSGPPCTYKKPLGCPLGLVTPPVDMSSLSTEAATVCPKPALHFMDTQNSTCRRPAAFSVQSVLQTSGNCYSDAFQDRNNRGELHETIETCSAADVPLQEQAPSHSAHNQSLLTSARSSPDLSISARETQEKAGSMHVRHGRSEESDTSTSGLSSACNSSEKLVLHSKQPSQTDYDDMLPIYEFDEDDPQMKESSDNGWDSFSSSMSQARKPLFSVCADLRSMAT